MMKKKVLSLLLAVCLVVGMLPVAASAAGSAFLDVPNTHWAYHHVQRAAEKGWVTGMGGGRYAPERRVTGAEFVTMITKSLYFEEVAPGREGEPWYQPYVDVAQAHGLLTNGLNEKTVLDNPLNRYRMAAFLFNVAKEAGAVHYVNGGILTYDGVTVLSSSNASNYIGDWATIPGEYREPVMGVYALSLLSGMDEYGTFGGQSYLTRAQAAVVLNSANALVDYGLGINLYAAEVVELVNEERAKAGLGELRVETNLQFAATERAVELIQEPSHTRPDGSDCFTILSEYGIPYYTAGENIAFGFPDPEMVMMGWMNSPGHRSNILSPGFEAIGVGVVEYGGNIYWTQLFIG